MGELTVFAALPLLPALAVICFRFPVVLAVGAIAVSMVFAETTITRLGVGGLNIVDAAVLMMVPVCVVHFRLVSTRLYARPHAAALWLLALLAAAGVLHGLLAGHEFRGILRDLRFYVYLLVTFHFAAVLDVRRDVPILAIAWGVLFVVQLWLVSSGRLIYNPAEAGSDMFGGYAWNSATHFLPVKSFAPLFFALAVVLSARAAIVPVKAALLAFVAAVLLILMFTYSRSLYVACLAGAVAVVLFCSRASNRGWRSYLTVPAAVVCLAAVLSAVTIGVAPVLSPEAAAGISLENIRGRFASIAQSDASIEDRRYGVERALASISASPVLGTGLGGATTYWDGAEFHNSYLWMARQLGLPAVCLFVTLLLGTLLQNWRALGRSSAEPRLRAMWIGLASFLVAMSVIAVGQPLLTNIVSILEWGLLLGLLASFARTSLGPREPTLADWGLDGR